MKEFKNKLILLIFIVFFISEKSSFSQYSSKERHKGAWESPFTWNPVWPYPQTFVNGTNISINGFVTVNGSLTFSGASGNLIVNDTLIIKGNLTLGDHNDLQINNSGILIVWGSLTIIKHADIAANGYLIVAGDIIKTGQYNEGSMTSNQNPAKVFAGGVVPSALTNGNTKYPALDCTKQNVYPNSGCSYGNLYDLANTPVFGFYRSTCTISPPTVSTSRPSTFCADENITLTSSTGTSYLWSDGSATRSISVSASGSYSVRVTDNKLCLSAPSETINVNVLPSPAKPAISPSGLLELCPGESTTLSTGAASAYTWSNGETTQNIQVSNSGTFRVKVTGANGCQSEYSDTVKVIVNPAPPAPTVSASGALTFCSGDSVMLISGTGALYKWSTGETSKTIKVFLPGAYFVKITGENGCESSFSDTVHVVVNQLPKIPVITASGPLNICSGGSLTLSASSEAGYIWSTGENTRQISVSNAGNYTVRVKNSAGCISLPSDKVSVVVNPLPAVSIAGPGSVCVNNITEVNGTPAGGTFKVLSGSATIQNNLLTPVAPGNLLIEYTYSGTCSNTVTKTIVVSGLPQVNAGSDQNLQFSNDTQMQAQLFPSERGEWTLLSGKRHIRDIHSPTTLITGLGEGKNVFQWKVSKGDCVALDEVVVNVEGLIIPSVITPNGDGQNDIFYIGTSFGKLKLVVFNKWGNVEYSSENYLNDWDGRNSKGVQLPNDTYFYVLHFDNGMIKKGSILIKK